jgi:peptidoglycan/LPS O-acetylase OafA/YrhL
MVVVARPSSVLPIADSAMIGVVKRLGYIPALDGLRGVAIALVLAFHFTGKPLGGTYGVDLFFVLSGFLITTLLLEESQRTGRVDLRAFYGRRARRLLPALAVMLSCYLVFEAAHGRNAVTIVAEYGLYAGNLFYVVVRPVDTTGLGHLWSLAEEEQFYLIWPLAMMLLARTRRPLRWLLALLTALTCYRFALIADHADMTRLYRAPDTNSEGLVLGAALAFARCSGFSANEWLAKVGLVLALPVVVVGQYSVGLPLFELGSAAMVAAAVSQTDFARLLASRALVWLGRLSYSLYLWHFPILRAFGYHDRLLALGVSVLVAWLSYRYVEQPFRRRHEPGHAIQKSPEALSSTSASPLLGVKLATSSSREVAEAVSL